MRGESASELTQPSGYSNFFSSSNDGKANSRRASLRAGAAAAPPTCPPVPQGGIIGRQKRVTFESKLTSIWATRRSITRDSADGARYRPILVDVFTHYRLVKGRWFN